MSIPPSHIWVGPGPPANHVVERWFGFVSADAPSFETALKNMRDKTSASFPEANWIIQLMQQQTPNRVCVSGIAVKMDET
jgi:hypothetical protein